MHCRSRLAALTMLWLRCLGCSAAQRVLLCLADTLPTFDRWSKQLEGKGGLRSVVLETAGAVGDSAGAIGAHVQDSLKGLVTMRSFKLHIPPGEILLADATIEVVSKDGTMASLLQSIRERIGVRRNHRRPCTASRAPCAAAGQLDLPQLVLVDCVCLF